MSSIYGDESLSLSTASWPSPATDYVDRAMSIDREVLTGSTFVVRVHGDELAPLGIREGDRLVVDLSLPPVVGQVIVVEAQGQRWVGRYACTNGRAALVVGERRLPLTGTVRSWGVVTYGLHHFTPEPLWP